MTKILPPVIDSVPPLIETGCTACQKVPATFIEVVKGFACEFNVIYGSLVTSTSRPYVESPDISDVPLLVPSTNLTR